MISSPCFLCLLASIEMIKRVEKGPKKHPGGQVPQGLRTHLGGPAQANQGTRSPARQATVRLQPLCLAHEWHRICSGLALAF